MLPRKTNGDVMCAGGIFGVNFSKTFRCVYIVSRLFKSKPYSPFQRNVSPGTFSRPGEVDSPPAEDLLDVGAEVVADDRHDAHLGEERRGNREVGGGAADNAIRFAERSFDGIERDRPNSKNRIHERYFPMMGARSFLTCAGTASGRVMSANFSAEPHSHERATGSFVMASAMAR